jgi:hypothetical protein
MVQIKFFEQHFGVKGVILIDVDVDHLIFIPDFLRDKVLNGINLMVDKIFFAVDIG